MPKSQALTIDLTEQECFEKFNLNQSFTKVYETKLPGKGIIHEGHPACEYQEHYPQQHGIVVHLKPEHNSIRRMGDSVEMKT